MDRADIDGVTLEYETAGNGDPVVFIHGALVADLFRPPLGEPDWLGGLVAYRRRGYGNSTPAVRPVRVEEHAADCLALMRHLGIEGAHIAGHSLGGCIALQMALDAPQPSGPSRSWSRR